MKLRLREGEVAVVGYGSLLSAGSISRTINREYGGPFVLCHVEGWRRSWDASMPNEAFYFLDHGERVYPRKILYLNCRPLAAGATMNVALFVLGGDELKAMRDREWIYGEQIVTSALRGVTIEGGDAVMYVARDEHVLSGASSREEAAVRASYLRILDAALQSTTPPFRAEYAATTDPVPPLMIDDVLDPERPTPWERAGVTYHPERQINR